MHSRAHAAHSADQFEHRHVAESGLLSFRADEHKAAFAGKIVEDLKHAVGQRNTVLFFRFIRDAGTVQSRLYEVDLGPAGLDRLVVRPPSKS